ncbi:TPA: molecular chaperone DnaJ [Candidatus Sumerlaeota bacterium]|nr:molecular chaperone DnaJ [Candidatus Sumerlaeota bacterium]
MAKFRDYYEILGIQRNAEPDEIKSSYRRLARKYHPDLNKDDPAANAKFREVQEAYDVLSDPDKRRQYNALGSNYRDGMDFQIPPGWAAGPRTGGSGTASGSGGGFSDFFDILFGVPPPRARAAASAAAHHHHAGTAAGGTRTATAPPPTSGNIDVSLTVTLEEIHGGVTKRMKMNVTVPCSTCSGSGLANGQACTACEGHGSTSRPKSLEIKVPQNAKEGMRLRLAGQGGVGSDGTPGDLMVRIKIAQHPVFTPDGTTINVELPVAPWEAVLGGEVDVPTLDGMVKMKLPPGTQSGVKMRLQQRGLHTETGRGDEIVRIKVLIPTEITERERHLFRQLRDISHFRPRVKERSMH